MSDMRTKYLVGTTIASIAVLVGALGAFPIAESISVNNVTPVAALYGHGTIVLTQPDGTTKYIQTDNIVLDDGIDNIVGDLFGTLSATDSATTFTNLKLHHGPAVAASNNALSASFQEAAVGPTSNTEVVTSGAPGNSVVTLVFPTITIADNSGDDGVTDGNTLLESISLDNDLAGTRSLLNLSLTSCAGGCAVVTGTTVDVTVAVTVSG